MANPIPPGPAAVLDALGFRAGSPFGLASLTAADWREALAYSDENRVTLLWFRAIEHQPLPDWVRKRLNGNLSANRLRVTRLRQIYERFAQADVEHLMLKGLSQWPDFTADAAERAQYDLDLYCPAHSMQKAFEVVRDMGYEPLGEMDKFPTDHLPVMIQKSGWEWKGDFFDIEIPIAVELHFRFWDTTTERFGPATQDGFWDRRVVRQIDGLAVHTLQTADALAYTCQHPLRHLLRANSPPIPFS